MNSNNYVIEHNKIEIEQVATFHIPLYFMHIYLYSRSQSSINVTEGYLLSGIIEINVSICIWNLSLLCCTKNHFCGVYIRDEYLLGETQQIQNICKTFVLRRWSNIAQMLYKCFVFTGHWCTLFLSQWTTYYFSSNYVRSILYQP